MPIDFSISKVCGWRNFESETASEFWMDRQALMQRTKHMSETQRTVYRRGIVEEFNEGLDQILGPNQAVGQVPVGDADQ